MREHPGGTARELRNKVAVVTGGTSGIGRAIARRFLQEGAAVAIVGRDAPAGQRAAAELQAEARADRRARGAGECVFVQADLADSGQVRAAVDAVAARWRQLHVLVNNAALMLTGALLDMPDADWDRTFAVNLRAPFLLAKYALPAMPPGGAIVNISSVHAVATDLHSAAYTASKGGLEALTRALALECRERQVRVNALRLGAVDTAMLWENPDVKSGAEQLHPAEVGRPAQVAEAALFLASERASFITGAVLTADGGRLPILCSRSR